jgi:hypothetical protein
VGVVDQPVKDGVGNGGFTEGVVPVADRELAGDDGGAELVAVLDDLEQVGSLLGCERSQGEVVDDQDADLAQAVISRGRRPSARARARALSIRGALK